jgi:hypothetical protein
MRKAVWRAQDHGVRQLWQADVVGKAAAVGQELKILFRRAG